MLDKSAWNRYFVQYYPWLSKVGKVRTMDTHHLLLSGWNCHTVRKVNLGLVCTDSLDTLSFNHNLTTTTCDLHVWIWGDAMDVLRSGSHMLTPTYTLAFDKHKPHTYAK